MDVGPPTISPLIRASWQSKVGRDHLSELALVDGAGEGPFRPFSPLILATSVEEEMGLPLDMRCGLHN